MANRVNRKSILMYLLLRQLNVKRQTQHFTVRTSREYSERFVRGWNSATAAKNCGRPRCTASRTLLFLCNAIFNTSSRAEAFQLFKTWTVPFICNNLLRTRSANREEYFCKREREKESKLESFILWSRIDRDKILPAIYRNSHRHLKIKVILERALLHQSVEKLIARKVNLTEKSNV